MFVIHWQIDGLQRMDENFTSSIATEDTAGEDGDCNVSQTSWL